jgi:hypothetical protein
VDYYRRFCESVGLNWVTRPLALIKLNGKLTMYATRDCAEQLRKVNEVSVVRMETQKIEDVHVVRVVLRDKTGREDIATGAVAVGNLKGDALANALMKAETKAKRRGTLSISGLGILDESEVETIAGAQRMDLEGKPIGDPIGARPFMALFHAARKMWTSDEWEEITTAALGARKAQITRMSDLTEGDVAAVIKESRRRERAKAEPVTPAEPMASAEPTAPICGACGEKPASEKWVDSDGVALCETCGPKDAEARGQGKLI